MLKKLFGAPQPKPLMSEENRKECGDSVKPETIEARIRELAGQLHDLQQEGKVLQSTQVSKAVEQELAVLQWKINKTNSELQGLVGRKWHWLFD